MKIRLTYLLCLLSLFLKAQKGEYHYLNYTIKDGLPTNELYSAFAEEQGTMLFGSDRGLIRYDGTTFKTIPFAEEDLTLSTNVFDIISDFNGTIWVNTYRHGVFFLEHDTLKPHPFNNTILKQSTNAAQRQIAFDQRGYLYFCFISVRNPFIYELDLHGGLKRIANSNVDRMYLKEEAFNHLDERPFRLFSISGKPVFQKPYFANRTNALTNLRYNQFWDSTQTISIRDSAFSFFKTKDNWRFIDGAAAHLVHCMEDDIYINHRQCIFVLDTLLNQKGIIRFDNLILAVSAFENNLLVGTRNGLHLVENPKSSSKRKITELLKNTTVSQIVRDHTGGLWVSSTNKGVFYFPNILVKQIEIEGNNLNAVKVVSSDSLLAFLVKPGYFEIQKSIGGETLFRQNIDFVNPIYITNDYVQFHRSAYSYKKNQIIHDGKLFAPLSADAVKIPDTDTLIFATREFGIQKALIGNRWIPNKPSSDTSSANYAISYLKKRLLVGDAKGVYTTDLNLQKKTRYLPNKIKGHVTSIKGSKDYVWISTINNGVFLVLHDSLFYHSKTDDTKVPSVCGKMVIENDSVVWLSSFKGLIKLSFDGRQVKSTLFNTDFGLISNRINSLTLSNGILYLATTNGICYAKTSDLVSSKENIPFSLSFPNLNIKDYTKSHVIELEPGKREIYFTVREKSTRHKVDLSYSYSLNGNSDQTIESNNNSISFGNLEPGLNTIFVNMANANLVWNSKPLEVKIWVPPFLYEKLWFRVVIIVSISALMLVSIVLFNQRLNRKRKRRFDFALARYNALSLQLNPHFIFNSLNNIQYLSISNNYVGVNQFVAKLARLTRNILEHSKFQTISLKKEIENLNIYLQIEAIRFEHKPIAVDLNIDPILDLEKLQIPPMLIQPIVENAIWHGLLNKKANRQLQITLKSVKGGFEVLIEDNGIGLHTKQAGKTSFKGKTSVGLKNTKNRIALYNEMKLGYARFSIDELKENNKTAGTIAHFVFKSNTPNIKST